jgi:hypothetical protein
MVNEVPIETSTETLEESKMLDELSLFLREKNLENYTKYNLMEIKNAQLDFFRSKI